MKYIKSIVALAVIMFSSMANAAFFSVEWTDNNGPQWTGVVDTTANSLVIQTWVEGASGTSYWTPTSPPLTFQAYMAPSFPTTFASLSSFDVLDNWDGTIGPSWGFLSDLTKDAISWNEGIFTGNSSRLGWGLQQRNDGSINNDFTNETEFMFVPSSSTENSIVRADTVNVSVMVPEPSIIALFSLGLLGIGFAHRRKA